MGRGHNMSSKRPLKFQRGPYTQEPSGLLSVGHIQSLLRGQHSSSWQTLSCSRQPPAASEPLATHCLEQEVICCSEQAGHTHFGIEGRATDFKAGKYSVLTTAGVHIIAEQHLALLSSKANTKPLSWPTFRSPSREDMKDCQWLSPASGLLGDDEYQLYCRGFEDHGG